jgi:hypothetical protein
MVNRYGVGKVRPYRRFGQRLGIVLISRLDFVWSKSRQSRQSIRLQANTDADYDCRKRVLQNRKHKLCTELTSATSKNRELSDQIVTATGLGGLRMNDIEEAQRRLRALGYERLAQGFGEIAGTAFGDARAMVQTIPENKTLNRERNRLPPGRDRCHERLALAECHTGGTADSA